MFRYANIELGDTPDLELGQEVQDSEKQNDKSTQTPEQKERQEKRLKEMDESAKDVMEFQKACREVFVDGWLCEEGDWLCKLSYDQMQFLRELLGLKMLDKVQSDTINKDQ